ncbi:MAG: endonuclease/exonuclease/phosphatase family protein [Phycisphaerae bacterium]|nr:endonuclease/exonuclease/phosphatase family protein [Phycisphaerae bacterium]
MRKIYLITVTAFIILSGCISPLYAASRTIQFNPSQRTEEVKVMTFNIRVDTILDGWHRWKQRKYMVADTIKSNAADIIGLQEAEEKQLRLIQQAMPQYNKYAVGRNDGRSKGETCAIFYRKDRFVLLNSDTFWFSNTPSVPGSKDWGNLWPRICTWVRLMDRTTGKAFYVYNVHLDNLSQNSRELSAKMLAGKIAARKTRDPFIVMGDFNMELSNPAMRYLQNYGSQTPYPRMIDAWSSVHFRERPIGTRHGFRGSISGPTIDHIPVCENTIPLEVKIDRRQYDGKYPSDHFPVIAKILFRDTNQITYKDPKIETTAPAIIKPTKPGV